MALTEAVARSYHKLLAYKDEYEVARLYSDPQFRKQLQDSFDGDYKLGVHLAPPLLSRVDPATGEPRKREFGPWIFPVLRALARLKGLRGTPFDPFGYTAERRMERRLIADYEREVEELLRRLTPGDAMRWRSPSRSCRRPSAGSATSSWRASSRPASSAASCSRRC